MPDTTFDQEAILGKKATKSDADKAHEERQAKVKKDPFANLDTSALEADLQSEEAAAQSMGLTSPEPELLPEDIKPKDPWMRRDYSPYHEAWDQIITAPKSTFIPYASKRNATNARGEFYKARAVYRRSQGHLYPEHLEQLMVFTISYRAGRDRKTGKQVHVLIFDRQQPVPATIQSIDELDIDI